VDGEEGAADTLENPDFLRHLGERVGPGNAFVGRNIPTHQELTEAEREDVEEALRGEAGGGEVEIAVGESARGVEALAFGEPLEIATLAPESEVDLGDERTVEL